MLDMGYLGTMLETWDQEEKPGVCRVGKEYEGAQPGNPAGLWEVDNPRNKNPLTAKRPAELILEELKQ